MIITKQKKFGIDNITAYDKLESKNNKYFALLQENNCLKSYIKKELYKNNIKNCYPSDESKRGDVKLNNN